MPDNSGESKEPINCLFHQQRITLLYPSGVNNMFFCVQAQCSKGVLQAFNTCDMLSIWSEMMSWVNQQLTS